MRLVFCVFHIAFFMCDRLFLGDLSPLMFSHLCMGLMLWVLSGRLQSADFSGPSCAALVLGWLQQLQGGPLDSHPLWAKVDSREKEEGVQSRLTLAGSVMIGQCVGDMLMSWSRVRSLLLCVWQTLTCLDILLEWMRLQRLEDRFVFNVFK